MTESLPDNGITTNVSTAAGVAITGSNVVKDQASRPKVAFSNLSSEKSKDGSTETPTATTNRKSGWPPMQRRGSRKQTLSLNPEEREALENLIEEVLMDGMGDTAADSDGSSSDSDDAEGSPSLEAGSSSSSTALKVADIAAKLNSLGATSGSTGNKKYYPGQLKVALKHMSNLPPRFVRKLAKAQQYLDAASSAKVLARPTPIIGGIEEEEETGATAHAAVPAMATHQHQHSPHLHSTDDLRPAASTGNQAHSPTYAQQERSKIKETKILEAKKQIRTLLNDRDQYVDEKSVTSPTVTSVVTSSTEGPGLLSSTVDSSVSTAEAFKKAVNSPVLISSSNSSSIGAPVNHNSLQTSDIQLHGIAPPLSTSTFSSNVPDYQLHYAQLPQAGYSSASATAPQMHNFNIPPPNVVQSGGQMLQADNVYARQLVQPRASQVPDYVAPQSAVIQGLPQPQSAAAAGLGYFSIPSIYNTPPPPLPQSTSLVTASQVAGISQPETYGLQDSQYQIPLYSSNSPPYQQNPSQLLQNSVYAPYTAPSYSTPVASYQIPVVSQATSAYPLVNQTKNVAQFPFGVHQQQLQQQQSLVTTFPSDVYQFPQGEVVSRQQQQEQYKIQQSGQQLDFNSQRFRSPGPGSGHWQTHQDHGHHHPLRSHHTTPTVRFSTPKNTSAPRSRHTSESRHYHYPDADLPVSGHLPDSSKKAMSSSRADLNSSVTVPSIINQSHIENNVVCSISDMTVPSTDASSIQRISIQCTRVADTKINGALSSGQSNTDTLVTNKPENVNIAKVLEQHTSTNQNVCTSCHRPLCHLDLSSTTPDIALPDSALDLSSLSHAIPTSMTLMVSRKFVQQLNRMFGENKNASEINSSEDSEMVRVAMDAQLLSQIHASLKSTL